MDWQDSFLSRHLRRYEAAAEILSDATSESAIGLAEMR
jgi:hypothetical protein